MNDMKMRDQFAMAALQGLLSDSELTVPKEWTLEDFQEDMALAAYGYADAMMKARQAQGEGK